MNENLYKAGRRPLIGISGLVFIMVRLAVHASDLPVIFGISGAAFGYTWQAFCAAVICASPG